MATTPFRPIATCSPSSENDSYIYSIVPTANNGLAVISSSDELVVLDRGDLRKVLRLGKPTAPTGVTCLQPGGHEGAWVVCAGRDGSIVTLDVRSQDRVASMQIGKEALGMLIITFTRAATGRSVSEPLVYTQPSHSPLLVHCQSGVGAHNLADRAVTALACSDTELAVGTELAQQQAIVSVWDRRQNAMRWQSTENNDDITDLHFHPSRPRHLLSGGIDGLVSIFDTNVSDEDDSLLQVVNHGPIHKAGFLSDAGIYALSHDEQFSIHAVTSNADDTAAPPAGSPSDPVADDTPPVHFGDLRPVLQCDYAIDVMQLAGQCFVATGTHTHEPHVDLVQLVTSDRPRLLYDNAMRLVGAHGEEIVRSIYVDEQSQVIYTAGEDGHVTAFQAEHESPVPTSPRKQVKKGTKNADSIRFRPY